MSFVSIFQVQTTLLTPIYTQKAHWISSSWHETDEEKYNFCRDGWRIEMSWIIAVFLSI